ncbi:hypothetical protein OV203_26745 [Nannocystis sp. ILAH1]|uniref:hypothetical protein n=1 Tax=Nannocystis sp. ILAH1 TaxID=2996789 RepID=UPI00227115D8|nr:hypothetical protein [Nannocystis sp. ILAH1]MCY0990772.1 hypothetical protein [Nannocystis sp. ILAH1]
MSPRPLPLLLLAACALRPPGDYQTTETTTDTSAAATTVGDGATTVPEPATSSTTSPPLPTTMGPSPTGGTDTSASAGDDTGAMFLVPFDEPGPGCDPWTEDCPPGEKCMPYASDGGNAWNNTKCSPIAPNPAGVGEPCQPTGAWTSGEDTCDKHMMCWPGDIDELTGTCVAFCDGSPEAPSCAPPKTTCHVSGSSVLLLCLPMCDPILQDCPGGHLCLAGSNPVDGFICVIDASGEEGQAFDPCQYINACDPGLFCTLPELATECDPIQDGCCLPVCDLNAPNTCPGAGQECLPWSEEGQATPGFEHVGICGLPMP